MTKSQPANMPTWEEVRHHVAQAQAIVSTQAGCTLDEALFLMTERGQDRQQSLADIASAVIERRIRFPALNPKPLDTTDHARA